jgi:hypothetical protein
MPLKKSAALGKPQIMLVKNTKFVIEKPFGTVVKIFPFITDLYEKLNI